MHYSLYGSLCLYAHNNKLLCYTRVAEAKPINKGFLGIIISAFSLSFHSINPLRLFVPAINSKTHKDKIVNVIFYLYWVYSKLFHINNLPKCIDYCVEPRKNKLLIDENIPNKQIKDYYYLRT